MPSPPHPLSSTPSPLSQNFILKAWVRIGKSLGPDFVPYLPMVVEPLMAMIETNPETELTEDQVRAVVLHVVMHNATTVKYNFQVQNKL